MDITESLLQALTLFGLGMGFVFLFLGLLMLALKLMEKFIPADAPIVKKEKPKKNIQSETSPQLVAAITAAVWQYQQKEKAVA